MIIRRATSSDTPQIVDLLRSSLGEGSTEKSLGYWNWKHVANPFGSSPVLIAEIDGVVAGVRAFMQWKWQFGGKTYRALRAVDTATHPDYRGKGIFKQLTLQLVKECREEGFDFIFNTPNDQSRPGYLKMGWQQIGKLPVRLRLCQPIRLLKNALFPAPDGRRSLPEGDNAIHLPEDELGWIAEVSASEERFWRTDLSINFLRWRYQQCPVRQYSLVAEPSDYLIFYYFRHHRLGVELRVVEYLVRPGKEAAASCALQRILQETSPDVVTIAPSQRINTFFLPPLPIGLNLTFRRLTLTETPDIAMWNFSLGDFELF